MTNPLDQLNLRPQERRILVIVFSLTFVVLNWIFVRPLFGQWSVAGEELSKSRRTLERYQAEIAKSGSYTVLKSDLEKEGSKVLTEALQLQRIVDQQATSSGVAVSRYSPVNRSTGATNQFFEEQGLSIDFTTYSTNLIEFLVGLAQGNSMIRVQEMNLKPDASGTKLNGNILFVASYQKKNPGRTPAATTTTAAAGGTTPASAPKSTNTATATVPIVTNKPGRLASFFARFRSSSPPETNAAPKISTNKVVSTNKPGSTNRLGSTNRTVNR